MLPTENWCHHYCQQHSLTCKLTHKQPKNFHCYCGLGQYSQYSDSLQAGRFRDQTPVGGQDLLNLSRPAPGAHPASYTIGTRPFLGVKWPGHGVDHLPPSSDKVKERVQLYVYSPSGTAWPVLG